MNPGGIPGNDPNSNGIPYRIAWFPGASEPGDNPYIGKRSVDYS